jgi:hypothetical protein
MRINEARVDRRARHVMNLGVRRHRRFRCNCDDAPVPDDDRSFLQLRSRTNHHPPANERVHQRLQRSIPRRSNFISRKERRRACRQPEQMRRGFFEAMAEFVHEVISH